MNEGIEAEPITPAAGEVSDADVRVAGCLPLAPDQQSFLGRQQGCAGPKLLLEEQGSMSPCRGSGEAAEPASRGGGWLGNGLTLLPQPGVGADCPLFRASDFLCGDYPSKEVGCLKAVCLL